MKMSNVVLYADESVKDLVTGGKTPTIKQCIKEFKDIENLEEKLISKIRDEGMFAKGKVIANLQIACEEEEGKNKGYYLRVAVKELGKSEKTVLRYLEVYESISNIAKLKDGLNGHSVQLSLELPDSYSKIKNLQGLSDDERSAEYEKLLKEAKDKYGKKLDKEKMNAIKEQLKLRDLIAKAEAYGKRKLEEQFGQFSAVMLEADFEYKNDEWVKPSDGVVEETVATQTANEMLEDAFATWSDNQKSEFLAYHQNDKKRTKFFEKQGIDKNFNTKLEELNAQVKAYGELDPRILVNAIEWKKMFKKISMKLHSDVTGESDELQMFINAVGENMKPYVKKVELDKMNEKYTTVSEAWDDEVTLMTDEFKSELSELVKSIVDGDSDA